jgi:hypothetical protein
MFSDDNNSQSAASTDGGDPLPERSSRHDQ